jgi:SAM-dependent methyltransferase
MDSPDPKPLQTQAAHDAAASAANAEKAALAQRYARRDGLVDRYSLLRPEVWQMVQERQRALIRLLLDHDLTDLPALRVVEVGCGAGGNLLELLRLGFLPENLRGIELLPDRAQAARRCLPQDLAVIEGDAAEQALEPGSVDIVLQSTVFSSLLDDGFQQRLADAMWSWLRPGGGVLWYDFTVDNPRNPDVRGVPLARVGRLFPAGRLSHRHVTLAPPLARAACRVHPALYGALNVLPLLRTHVLAWIAKP